jgi:Rrf2 family protein
MRFTAQEEYGLRCAVQLARAASEGGLTIPQLAARESLTPAYVGKLLRILRQAGLVRSTRGQAGGYTLSRAPGEIDLSEVLRALDGPLYSESFCERYTGSRAVCVNATDCGIRGLWSTLSLLVDGVLSRCKLSDLVCDECASATRVRSFIDEASG